MRSSPATVLRIDPRYGDVIIRDRPAAATRPTRSSPRSEQVPWRALYTRAIMIRVYVVEVRTRQPRPAGHRLPDPSGPRQAPVRAGGSGDRLRRGRGQVHRPRGRLPHQDRRLCRRGKRRPGRRLRRPARRTCRRGRRRAARREDGHCRLVGGSVRSSWPRPSARPTSSPSRSCPATGKACRVIVPDDQLSLAIGKEGQNARLAARLTGYKIDIRPASQAGCG